MKGPIPALLPDKTICILLIAFETCGQCNQISGVGGMLNCNNLIGTIQRVVGPIQKVGTKIVQRLLKKSETAFKAQAAFARDKEQRTRWTTCANIEAWFSNWRTDLENLRFGTTLCNGRFDIAEDQLCQIVNLDESAAVSSDGNDGQCGGRPRVTVQDPRFLNCSEQCSKPKTAMTFIGSSMELNQPLPP